MKNKKIPDQYPKFVFSPSTRNQKRDLRGIRYHHIFKSAKGRSHIYERYTDNQDIAALRIDGPSDSSMVLDHLGNVKLLTGENSVERGPGSGKLMIKSWGQQQLHNARSDVQYNAESDEEGIALSILAYGDIVEENRGSDRVIRATKIIITADTELVLKANHIVLQAGESGNGKLTINSGVIDSKCVNSIERVSGQKVIKNFSEFTILSKNVNSVYNLLLAGHYNSKVIGSYYQAIKGWKREIIVGKSVVPSFYAYKVKVGGNIDIESSLGIASLSGRVSSSIKSTGGSVRVRTGTIGLNGVVVYFN